MTISKTGSKIVSLWLAAALVSGLFAIMPLSVSAAPLGLSAPENVKWNDAERCVSYQKIANPEHRIDSNGYVHFSTSQAGNIVISNGPLQQLNLFPGN